MADILIRGVDPKVVARLKKQAKAHGRSLQAEAKGILENAAMVDLEAGRKLAEKIRRSFGDRKFTDSAELVREDRDR
jgi:antitoxin FitA